jgi:hypothetical protein
MKYSIFLLLFTQLVLNSADYDIFLPKQGEYIPFTYDYMLWTDNNLPDYVDSIYIDYKSEYTDVTSYELDNSIPLNVRIAVNKDDYANSIVIKDHISYMCSNDYVKLQRNMNKFLNTRKYISYMSKDIQCPEARVLTSRNAWMNRWTIGIKSDIRRAFIDVYDLNNRFNTLEITNGLFHPKYVDHLIEGNHKDYSLDSLLAIVEEFHHTDTSFYGNGLVDKIEWRHYHVYNDTTNKRTVERDNGQILDIVNIYLAVSRPIMRLQFTEYENQYWTTAILYRDNELVWTAKRELISFKD